MGVYIKGMEMPENCRQCGFYHHNEYYGYESCGATHFAIGDRYHPSNKQRYPNCPLVEVPKHGRLGDLDALKKTALIRSERRGRLVNVTDMVISAYDIETATTIIEAEE